MGYEYEPTKAELKAAALLREKGWRVAEPACPLCGGLGGIIRIYQWIDDLQGVKAGSTWNDPCPNGCTPPSWYSSSSITQNENGWTLS